MMFPLVRKWIHRNRFSTPEQRTGKNSPSNTPYRPQVELLERREVPSGMRFAVGPNINISRLAQNQHEATIALDPTNPLHLFSASNTESGGGSMFGAFSTDGGTTWAGRLIATGSDGLPAAISDPQAVFDHFGNLYLVYIDVTGASSIGLSTDGGKTFSLLHTFAGGSDQPSVAVGANSVWVDFADFGNGGISTSGASVTGLGTVGAFSPQTLVPGSVVGNFGDIAVGPNGQVMVTYAIGPGVGQTQIFANLNPTGLGGTFGAATLATTTNVGQADMIPAQSNNLGIDPEPNFAWDQSAGAHRGRIYLVYTDAPSPTSTSTENFVRFSDNNGTTWSAPVKVSDDTGPNSKFLPSIVVDQTSGNVAVQWYDSRNDLGNGGPGDTNHIPNDDAQLFAAVSTDGGQSFGANLQVSTGTSNAADSEPPVGGRPLGYGDYEKTTAFFNGAFYPIWADNSNSTGDNPDGTLHRLDIYTAKVTMSVIPKIPPIFATGAGIGGGPVVNVYDSQTKALKFSFFAYDPSFIGGVRVAVGDVNGDGVNDIITAPGPGGGPHIKVFDGVTGALIQQFMAYAPNFLGGVFVAAGDVNGDGFADIVTGAGAGGGPQVEAFSGATGARLFSFFAYAPQFLGGVNVATGDVNGDGFADIITGPGAGGGPNIRVFSGATGVQLPGTIGSFMAYSPTFTGGVNVAAGDVSGNGSADIVTGPGAGGGPEVKVFSGPSATVVRDFMAGTFNTIFGGDTLQYFMGTRVAVSDTNGDGRADIEVTFGTGAGPEVRIFDASNLALLDRFFAYNPSFLGGVYIGGN